MAVTSKIAMAQQPLPLGWNYSYLNDGFEGPNGEYISKNDVAMHGSFHKAFAYMYGATGATSGPGVQTGSIGANGPAGPQGNITWGQNAISPIPSGSYVTSSASSIQPASTLSFETDHGRVTLDIKTGDLTIPGGMGREDAIREFWLGFQKHFKTTDTMVLETRIKELQAAVARAQATAAMIKREDENETRMKIAEKIGKKYAGEKFIMLKPDDLVRIIKEA